jgi:MFS family permease
VNHPETEIPQVQVATPAKIPMWKVLSFPEFRLYWIGRTISLAGDALQRVALPWLILNLTGSGMALSTVAVASTVPTAGLVLLGGVAVDWATPRVIIIASNIVRCLLVAAMAILAAKRTLNMTELLGIAIIAGITDAFSIPAFEAIPRVLVPPERLMPANSILDSTNQLGGLLGPAFAGMFVASFGVVRAFWVNSVSFFIFALILISSPARLDSTKELSPRVPANMWSNIGKGLRFVFHDPLIRAMFINTVFFSIATIGPVYIGVSLISKQDPHGAATMGILFSTYSGGTLVGSLLPGWWVPTRKRHRVFVQLPIFVALDLFAIGRFSQVLPLVCLLFFALGAYFGFITVFTRALRQIRTPLEWQARVASVLSLAGVSVLPISLLSAGALASRGATVVFWYSALLVLLVSPILASSTELRHFD